MSLTPAFLDELRARTPLSALIAPTVKLQQAGREWKACCPFHNEKTPSFTINDEKGFYHCFGCGAHGDAIRWLTDARGLPFMDAVKELAGKAGLDVPAPDPRARERAERASDLTTSWRRRQPGSPSSSAASKAPKPAPISRSAASARRPSAASASASRPTAAASSRTRSRSLGDDKLVETGMLIEPEEGGEPYDRFRGRLMIPIRDPRGRVIAFGGRILGAGEPKYLNSPTRRSSTRAARSTISTTPARPAARPSG